MKPLFQILSALVAATASFAPVSAQQLAEAQTQQTQPQTQTQQQLQNQSQIEDDTRVSIDPVVVTGTGTLHRLSDAPIAVTVLTGDELQAAGVTTLEGALLKLDPSFSITPLSTMGNTMTMNGLEGNYILFMVNGRRMIGSGADAPDLSRIDMANVRRIEILDGAASTLYGSDAIAGVVNIITDDGGGSGVELSIQSTVRNHGRYEQSVDLDGKEGRLGIHTSVNHQQSGGWLLNPMEENAAGELVPTSRLASFATRSDVASQRFTYDFTDRLSAYAEGSWYDYKQDRPLTLDGRETSYNYNMLHNNYTYGAGLSYVASEKMSLHADFHSDNYSSKYAYTRETGDFRVGDEETRIATKFYQATLKGVFALGRAHRLSAGVEYLDDRLDDFISTSATLPGAISNYTLSVFAQDELRLHRNWKAVVAARYLHHEKLGSHATPSAALMYSVGGWRLRASFANGYKTPTLSDIHTFFVSRNGDLTIGNEDLKPEKSSYGSFGAEYSTDWLTLSATGYINSLRDKVEVSSFEVSDAELARYQQLYGPDVTSNIIKKRSNIDRARVAGATLRARALLGAGFSVQGSYSYTDGRNLSAAEGADDRLDKLIPHSGALSAQWNKTWGRYRLGVDLGGQIRGSRYSTTYTPRIGDAPAYSLWDLHTTHTFSLGGVILSPAIGVDNLFDYRDDRPAYMHYVNASGNGATTMSPYSTLSPGRTFYFSLGIRL
ncbi:MAG: TonB-dependent receptor [Alistipes sp.]|jgi:outer membrane receptor for ferrienterochelin and colicins|nr:TonB-dependent receptor [Alistipes sp.]